MIATLGVLIFNPIVSVASTSLEFSYGASDYDLDDSEYYNSFERPETFKVSVSHSISRRFSLELFYQNYGDSNGYAVIIPPDSSNSDPGSFYEVNGLLNVSSYGLGIVGNIFKTDKILVNGRVGAHRWNVEVNEQVFFVRTSGDKTPITGPIVVDGKFWNIQVDDDGVSPYIGFTVSHKIIENMSVGVDASLQLAEIDGEKAYFKSLLLYLGFNF